jgi:hypothetical protein
MVTHEATSVHAFLEGFGLRDWPVGCWRGVPPILHAWHLRSYEKLTSEGLNYLRGDLTLLVEQVLPERFGGSASDYQLVEIEEDGMPFVEIVVSPRVGPVDGAAVSAAVYDWLRTRPGEALMADFWQDANTLRVVRRAPYATGAAKVLPLHRIAAGRSPARAIEASADSVAGYQPARRP